ncbi:MAG TPA: hypothetical protein DEP33_02595, partial [Alteromonas sp.]|nr:hypothetical protein [Alteromonas sp.]
MNRLLLLLLVISCAFSVPLQSQQDNRSSLFGGFKADNQAQVSIAQPVSLPADHAPHQGYQIEWWYLTLL